MLLKELKNQSGLAAINITRLRRSGLHALIVPQATSSYSQISSAIARGGVIAFRTDTFYGLGADPFNLAAIQRIIELKGREERKPILLLISDRDQVERFISERSKAFDLLAERLWPAALTLIGKAHDEVPSAITAGSKTVGLRLPDDDDVRALVRACGGALTATSANLSGEDAARTAQEVKRYFGAAVDLIVDGGEARSDRPSTVVDAIGGAPRLVREGLISWAEVKSKLGKI